MSARAAVSVDQLIEGLVSKTRDDVNAKIDVLENRLKRLMASQETKVRKECTAAQRTTARDPPRPLEPPPKPTRGAKAKTTKTSKKSANYSSSEEDEYY
jgi:hypothetical protein